MKKILSVCVLLMAASARLALPIEPSDFSPEAQKLLPKEDVVSVKLKDGAVVQGRLVERTAEKIAVKVRYGAISSTKIYQASDVAAVEKSDVAAYLAARLLEFELDANRSLAREDCARAIALFDEFVAKCPTNKETHRIREKRAQFASEMEMLAEGMEKIEGKWMTPVRGALCKFNLCGDKIKALEQRFSDIAKDDFKTDAGSKKLYEELRILRREAVRQLPKLLKDRVPVLLERRKFDEAAEEATAFLQFFVHQVIQSEKSAPDARKRGEGVFEGMDFGYVTRLQKDIIEAYIKAGLGKETPATVAREGGMVLVPGGYFLMGREDASLGDPDFPPHIVWVSAFLADKHEVSNAEYRKFVDHVKKTGDSSMEHPLAPPLKDHTPEGWKKPDLSRDNQPVVGIDWFDAYAYAKWAGKRLLAEAEWEKAARGMDQRIYPWGSDGPGTRIVNCESGRKFLAREMDRQNPPPPPHPQKTSWFSCKRQEAKEQPPPSTILPASTWDSNKPLAAKAIADSFDMNAQWESTSPYGLMHMSGNAAEWVSDWYSTNSYAVSAVRDPEGPEKGDVHVFRGGSYLSPDNELATTWRGVPVNDNMKRGCAPDGRPMIGFRCAKSLGIVKPQ